MSAATALRSVHLPLHPERAALFGERMIEEILEDVPHRHATFTVPKALRVSFERERMLLKILPPHHKQQRHQGLAGELGCDEALATATFGRLPHNSQALNIKGRSHRLRDLEKAVTQQS